MSVMVKQIVRTNLFLVMSLLVFTTCEDKVEKEKKEVIMFEKYIGSEEADIGEEVKQTKDGGYIIVGFTHKGVRYSTLLLVKTDKYGEVEWDQTFGNDYIRRGVSVLETLDGGYIVLGNISYLNGNTDIWLIKTDSQGNEEWSKTFGYRYTDKGYSINQTIDGGFIISGVTSNDIKDGKWNIWLIKTDSGGNEEWNQLYEYQKSSTGEYVEQTTDSGFILVGTQTDLSNPNEKNTILIKTNQKGIKEWEKVFDGDGNPRSEVVKQTDDGGFVIIGYTSPTDQYEPDVWVLRTNSKGRELWQKSYGGDDMDIGHSIDIPTDGGFILGCQTSSFGAKPIDFWLIKINSRGDVNWQRTYGGSGRDIGRWVEATSDGGYIMTGITDAYGSGGFCRVQACAFTGELDCLVRHCLILLKL